MVTMPSLDSFAQQKLDDLQRRHLRRALAETVREDGIWVDRDGKRLLSFSCNRPRPRSCSAPAISPMPASFLP
jgi:hypothetical protein